MFQQNRDKPTDFQKLKFPDFGGFPKAAVSRDRDRSSWNFRWISFYIYATNFQGLGKVEKKFIFGPKKSADVSKDIFRFWAEIRPPRNWLKFLYKDT